MNLDDRFWNKVRKGGQAQCWEWIGNRSQGGTGYGQFSVGNKLHGAHRVIWMATYGPILPGRHVLHHCDNKACVKPDHLYLGTKRDNALDMGRRSGFHNAKLTDDSVRQLRHLAGTGIPASRLADTFGISPAHARKVVSGRAKAHVSAGPDAEGTR